MCYAQDIHGNDVISTLQNILIALAISNNHKHDLILQNSKYIQQTMNLR